MYYVQVYSPYVIHSGMLSGSVCRIGLVDCFVLYTLSAKSHVNRTNTNVVNTVCISKIQVRMCVILFINADLCSTWPLFHFPMFNNSFNNVELFNRLFTKFISKQNALTTENKTFPKNYVIERQKEGRHPFHFYERIVPEKWSE